ncbi:MAG: hypothetical protein IK080_08090 [Clostridia bacterium]|nr:hypothetical protein [Clostridia bacterium]
MKEKNGRKKLPNWLRCLIGSIVFFLLASGAIMLFESMGVDMNHPTGVIENLLLWVWILLLLASMGFFAGMIVFIVKAISAKATARDSSPKETVYGKTISEGRTNGRVKYYHYNKDDTLHLKNATSDMTWGYVVTFLIVLFPVGVFFLIRKLIHEKTHYYDNGIKTIMLGCFVFVPAVLFLISLLVSENGAPPWMLLVIAVVASAAGLIALIAGFWLKHRGAMNNAFMSAITIDRITSIDTLSEKMHTDYSGAVRVIQRLIDAELLEDAYIYHKDRIVIVPGISEKIAVKCSMCGGTTVLYSSEKRECRYCGAEL